MMDGYKSMKDHMGKSYKTGGKMGYAHGGYAKSMDSMDNANMPRRKKDAADQRTKEFGDQGAVRPGYKKGGYASDSKVPKTPAAKGGYMKGGKHDKDMDYAGGGYAHGGKHDMDYDNDMDYKKGGKAKKKSKTKTRSPLVKTYRILKSKRKEQMEKLGLKEGGGVKVHNSKPMHGKY